MSMREIVREGYQRGNYQEFYGRDRSLNNFESNFFSEIEKHSPQGGKVLDLGCGTGVPYDRYLVSSGFSVTGVDFSEKHIGMAKKNVPEAQYIMDDLTSITFPEGFFDAVIMLYVLFHIPRDEHAVILQSAATMLKPGGVLLLTLGTHDSEYNVDTDWIGGVSMAWNSWSPELYMKELERSGFNSTLRQYEGNPGDDEYHLWVLATRK